MSLRREPIGPVPEETARIARAAFRRGNPYRKLRDELGTRSDDEAFAALFPPRGQPAAAPWRRALVTVLQFAAGSPDRQAAEAVRRRLGWTDLLGLALHDPGFDYSRSSAFRARLIAGRAELLLLEGLLQRVEPLGLLKRRGRQRTNSTHVLAGVRTLNRLERVGATLRAALKALAVVAPDWLRTQAPPEWYDRYSQRVENDALPTTEAARRALAASSGADGPALLRAIATSEPAWVRQVRAVQVLRPVGTEQSSTDAGELRWREVKEMPPPAEMIASPMTRRRAPSPSGSWRGSAPRST